MRDSESQIRDEGGVLTAIGLGDIHYAQHFREATGVTFPLLVDEERRAYRAASLRNASLIDLFRRDNFSARKKAKADGHRQHRLGRDPFQLGGSFVFAPGNQDLFIHASQTFGDNAPVQSILSVLVEYRRRRVMQ